MTFPFNIFERMEYKREFIKQFGKDRFQRDHQAVPESYLDKNGNHAVRSNPPSMPNDIFKWIKGKGWPLSIYIATVTKESNDLGSNVHFNVAEVKATTANVVEDVQAGTKKAIRTVLILGAIAVLIIYRKPISKLFKKVAK